MKHSGFFLFIALSFLFSITGHSQTKTEPVMYASEMPVYPGGESGMNAFIVKNTRYPKKAKKKGQTGKVYLQFVIEIDGTTSEHKVIRGIEPSYGLNEEALRVVSLLSGYTPANQNGHPVRFLMTIPLSFTLN